MQNAKPIAAILGALFLGMLVVAFAPGCQPSGQPVAGGSSLNTAADSFNTAADSSLNTAADDDAPAAKKEPAAEPAPAEPAAEPKPEIKPEAKPADAAPSEKPAEEKPATEKPADKPADKPAEKKADKPAQPKASDTAASGEQVDVLPLRPDVWNQWGGNGHRNNVPIVENPPLEWNPGKFDRKTGKWITDKAKNIKWVANLGSQSYGNTVVSGGKVWMGTNNSNGYLKRYPAEVDLGVLVCFDEKDGKFLWQHSSEKLPTGRVHDWELLGLCSSPLVEGDRLWFVTSRGEVRCLDAEGFYDGEDDGPVKNDPGRLFDLTRSEDAAVDKVAPAIAELDKGNLNDVLREHFKEAGMELPADVKVTADDKAKAPAKKWTFQAEVGGAKRDFYVALVGPKLSGFKLITADDKDEADVIWVFDMMKQLSTSQHNMCSCSVTSLGDILFVNTSNGVDEAHIAPPSPDAASFMAMNKNTGEVFWTDNSPGHNILHGQWGSPAVGIIGGVPQVIFGGGDGWMYSFRADKGKDGKPELLWKFDANPKNSILELGGRGTRNDLIGTPVIYDNKVYFATGQDPEHGEGSGILWCIDPTKRGDISPELAVNRKDPKTPIPVKRVQAVVESEGDLAIANPNSGVVWKYAEFDADGDGKAAYEETFHRSISSVAIKNDLLYVSDFSGVFHCINAQTGKPHWAYDMLAAAWGSPLIAGDYVYVGDEDGDIAIFEVSAEKQTDPVFEVNMLNSVYSTPIMAGGVLYIGNRDHLFAIQEGAQPPAAEKAGE